MHAKDLFVRTGSADGKELASWKGYGGELCDAAEDVVVLSPTVAVDEGGATKPTVAAALLHLFEQTPRKSGRKSPPSSSKRLRPRGTGGTEPVSPILDLTSNSPGSPELGVEGKKRQ
jgi:hypothetical protein